MDKRSVTTSDWQKEVDVYEIFLPLHASNETVCHNKDIWLLVKSEWLIFYSNNIKSLEDSGYKFKSIMMYSCTMDLANLFKVNIEYSKFQQSNAIYITQ